MAKEADGDEAKGAEEDESLGPLRAEISAEVLSGALLALVNYIPYNDVGLNVEGHLVKASRKMDACSGAILDVKSCKKPGVEAWKKANSEESISFFIYCFTKLIVDKSKLSVVVIPSSKKDNEEHGVTAFASRLAGSLGLEFSKNTLVRTESVASASREHAARDESLHLATLKVDASSLRDRRVLLIDDVTTTGSIKDASKRKLVEAGIPEAQIWFLALGVTIEDASYVAGLPRSIVGRHWELFVAVMRPLPASRKYTESAIQCNSLLYGKQKKEDYEAAEAMRIAMSGPVLGGRK